MTITRRWSGTSIVPSLLGVLLCLTTATTAASQGQTVELRWSFQAGDAHVYQQTAGNAMRMPMGEIVQSQTGTIRKEVLSVGEDGTARIGLTTESIRATMTGMAGSYQFDSTSDEVSDHPGAAMLAAMMGTTIEMTVKPDGTVSEMAGFDDMVERMLADFPTEDAEVRDQLREAFTEAAVAESGGALDQIKLPPGGVAVGDEWTDESTTTTPQGTMRAQHRYRLVDVAQVGGRQVAQIEVAGDVEFLDFGAGSPMAGAMPLPAGDIAGSAQFDLDRGLLMESSITMSMVMEMPGQAIEMEMTHGARLVDKP